MEIGRPKPPRLEELCDHYQISEDMILTASSRWFAGGQAAHDARYDTAATFLCLAAAHRKGDLRGVLPGGYVSVL